MSSKFVPPGTTQAFDDENDLPIELYESSRERETYDNLADLYAIIFATERLERAYARDAITRDEVSECAHSQIIQIFTVIFNMSYQY